MIDQIWHWRYEIMPKYPVQVQKDHIDALVATRKPLLAVAELIWNGFDADANKVAVRFGFNSINTLETIRVSDDGSGISHEDAVALFGNLGGSWKHEQRRTSGGRSLHGKSGKGRFRAFSLGNLIEWKTVTRSQTGLISFSIKSSASDLTNFEVSDPVPAKSSATGTEVEILNVEKNFVSLTSDKAHLELASLFAVYLSEYPDLRIDFAGSIVDPNVAQQHQQTYALDDIEPQSGERVSASLTIIEWKEVQERTLHFCDSRGISLHSISPGIQAPGFNFSAYIKSDYLRELDKDGLLILEEIHPEVSLFAEKAKSKMREHFRAREAEQTRSLVKEWKDKKIYPYEGEPSGSLETAERQVFDVVAVNLSAYLDNFEEAGATGQRFIFNLVAQSLRRNPESLQLILENVLNLPKDRQDDLAELLKKTSLTTIISSAKVVSDRLNFIRGLEILVFDNASKEQLLERDQLHQILAKEAWIFGEKFHLTSNEETLEEVLNKHLHLLGKREDDEVDLDPVEREGGKRGRIDLMLGRTLPSHGDERENLVVELKRPSKKIDSSVLGQVESYAIAVARIYPSLSLGESYLETTSKYAKKLYSGRKKAYSIGMRSATRKTFEVFKLSSPNGKNWWKIEGRPKGRRERFYFKTEKAAKKGASDRNNQIAAFGS
jgi:Histidine kinase-, DNA gyrase B-, and HSP90-like ATPase